MPVKQVMTPFMVKQYSGRSAMGRGTLSLAHNTTAIEPSTRLQNKAATSTPEHRFSEAQFVMNVTLTFCHNHNYENPSNHLNI